MRIEKQKIHFIAIGGSVMHNLAITLHNQGHTVTGSDDKIYEPSRSKLAKHGLLPQQEGWHPDRIDNTLDAIVLGMHARQDNPELQQAQALGLPIYSFPEYIYQASKHKQRVVIAGSHGKTTITAIIIHVLQYWKKEFDFVVGADIEGFEQRVKLTDAPVIIVEGDEYLSSALDPTPKMLRYQHHVGLISGIAWDHINVFPTMDAYVQPFERFADATPKGGVLVFCEDDDMATVIGRKDRADVIPIEYVTHPHVVRDEKTYLTTDGGDVAVQLFGKHNMQNINGARLLMRRLGITDAMFYEAIPSFKGASSRLELVNNNQHTYVFKDYAHAPSKLKATTAALKEQFPGFALVACLELHTFSSLNKSFLEQYKGTFGTAENAIVYYNPEVIAAKKMEPIDPEFVKSAFGRNDLQVFTDTEALYEHLLQVSWKGKNLLMMSSGNFNGLDMTALSAAVINA